jgi:hypothetical protein
MSNDRDARGLEDLVQRLDRLFFAARSTASSFRLAVRLRQNRRVAPIVLPASLETFISQHVGHDDISEACPLALTCLAARRNEVSRFEPNPQPPPNRGGSRNPVFTRLCRRLSEAVHKERQGTCSLGQDGASLAFGLGLPRLIFVIKSKLPFP